MRAYPADHTRIVAGERAGDNARLALGGRSGGRAGGWVDGRMGRRAGRRAGRNNVRYNGYGSI